MIDKLVIGGLVLAGLVLGIWGYGQQRYRAGEDAANALTLKLVNEQNTKVATLERRVRDLTQEKAHAIEQQRLDREAEAALALAAIQPVRLCRPARGSQLPGTPGAAPATDGAEAESELPLRAGEDIGPALVMLARACQRDNDDSLSWQDWYATARQALASPTPAP